MLDCGVNKTNILQRQGNQTGAVGKCNFGFET